MSSSDDYIAYLTQNLSEHRLKHSIGVMQTMEKLAEIYDLDKTQASTAGLLHDIAKELKPETYEKIVREAGIEIRCEEDKDYHFYLHAPVGAFLAKEALKIEDIAVLNAIETHSFYGVYDENFNATLHWCLHFSDIIEPNRDWERVRWLRENGEELKTLIYSQQLEKSIVLFTRGIIEWFTEDNLPVHPNIYRAYKDYSKSLN